MTGEIVAYTVAVISILSAVFREIYSSKSNAMNVKNDIIGTYETRLKQVDMDIQLLKKQISEMSDKLDKSEIERKRAEEILNLRNPEFERYMTMTLQLLTDIHSAVTPSQVTKL